MPEYIEATPTEESAGNAPFMTMVSIILRQFGGSFYLFSPLPLDCGKTRWPLGSVGVLAYFVVSLPNGDLIVPLDES